MELQDIRKEIDGVDGELVALFCRRMELSAKVAKIKKESGMPVLCEERERELLLRVSEMSGKNFEEYTKELYSTILGLSRAYQESILCKEGGK